MMEPTTVIALRGMEKSGLIRRVRGADDRRVTRVHLTPKARRLRDRLLQISQGVNDQGAEGIDPASARAVPPHHRADDGESGSDRAVVPLLRHYGFAP